MFGLSRAGIPNRVICYRAIQKRLRPHLAVKRSHSRSTFLAHVYFLFFLKHLLRLPRTSHHGHRRRSTAAAVVAVPPGLSSTATVASAAAVPPWLPSTTAAASVAAVPPRPSPLPLCHRPPQQICPQTTRATSSGLGRGAGESRRGNPNRSFLFSSLCYRYLSE